MKASLHVVYPEGQAPGATMLRITRRRQMEAYHALAADGAQFPLVPVWPAKTVGMAKPNQSSLT